MEPEINAHKADKEVPMGSDGNRQIFGCAAQLLDRFNPTMAFADGRLKFPDFRRGNSRINSDVQAFGDILQTDPEALKEHVLKELQPEPYLAALFKKEHAAVNLHYIAPIPTGRRLAFRVIATFEDESTAHEAILVRKDVRLEQLYTEYLALIGLNHFAIESGTDREGNHCGAYELVNGKSLSQTNPIEYAGFENQIASELGANFYAAYVFGKEDRCRANYFFSSTESTLGQVITSVDHEDLFFKNPTTLRKTAFNQELAILEDLPTYGTDRTSLLMHFEEAAVQQHNSILEQREAVQALVRVGDPGFEEEFNARLDSDPLAVLDSLYAIRARLEQNVFAVVKRALLGRW